MHQAAGETAEAQHQLRLLQREYCLPEQAAALGVSFKPRRKRSGCLVSVLPELFAQAGEQMSAGIHGTSFGFCS